MATEIYRTSILSGDRPAYTDQAVLDAASLVAASQCREEQQARVPNFTDDDERFDATWAAGYIVATIAEQDTYLSDPEGYRAELQQRFAPQLSAARVIDAEPGSAQMGDE